MYKHVIILYFFLSGLCLQGQSQLAWQQDSLRKEIQQKKADTSLVNTLYSYGFNFLPDSLERAAGIFREALQLSRELHYHKGVADFACYYMYIQDMRGEYMASLFMVQQAVTIYASLRDTLNLMRAISYCGNEYQQISNFPMAAGRYLEALKLADKAGDSLFACILTNNLASVFIALEDYEKGFDYANRAYQYGVTLKSKRRLASALINMGTARAHQQRNTEGRNYFSKAIELGRQIGDSSYVLDGIINLASIYSDLGKHDTALACYANSLAVSKKYPSPEYLTYIYLGYGQELYKIKNYAQAETYVDKAIALSQQHQALDELRQAYLTASDIWAAQGQYRQAFELRKAYEIMNDSLVGDATRKSVQRLEMQYQTEKKDRDLAEKKLLLMQKDMQLQRKNMLIFIFIVGSALLLVLAFIVWQRLKHRHWLQAQRLQTLEIEKTVQVLEAMVQGEEKERTRLSKDLHDGVGGLLSAVKMHFGALKHERIFLQTDSGFNHALGMLDDAIGEVRKTAHNLMPEVLARMGLSGALRLYCQNVSHSRKLTIGFYSIGKIDRFKGNFELSVYRIVQELVNNIIKHSCASEALVQLTQHDQLLTITVEDNGIGFSLQTGEQSGMGLNSLYNRIRALNGKLDMHTTPGKGTTAYIEFNISIMQLTEVEM
ncbi:MAG TPA: tetratricopeptide repeat protein [Chitinophaga sp.]|uniref:tetratricopeptide repeat-containing sensor histidine kinase n=1 Tax=Chitinophaga sp. TaxID=1869181 RepID=UPI002CA39E42|nr:tetratricopeptide repeat protein [Chitinophaga sp.]HVI48106.1 tetratricopeptide repeat protein [Chitinophaga sp.]